MRNPERTLQEERIVRAQMAQRIQDMEGQLAKEEAHRVSLEEKHQHAREALEHFRTAAKEQREQDQRQFEQQIQFLQGELRNAKETVNTRNSKNSSAAMRTMPVYQASSPMHAVNFIDKRARYDHCVRPKSSWPLPR
jgi:predicted RNase H-like nuclease (RuvC/YqgF family)